MFDILFHGIPEQLLNSDMVQPRSKLGTVAVCVAALFLSDAPEHVVEGILL